MPMALRGRCCEYHFSLAQVVAAAIRYTSNRSSLGRQICQITSVKLFNSLAGQPGHWEAHHQPPTGPGPKSRRRQSSITAASQAAAGCLASSTEGISALRCTLRDVPGDHADLLADTLLGLGAQSASVTEHRPPGSQEQKIFDKQQGTREVWDRCTVTAHFSPDHDIDGTLQVVRVAMQLEGLSTDISEIADSDWLDGICASYQPTQIVEDLWIIPRWSNPVDPDALNIVVEPGLAFGTGEHPTTQLCLKMLHSMNFEGKHIIDYGTGSGVLALLALKLGAKLAVGVDTDPIAVRAAQQNGTLNRFDGRWVTLRCGSSLEEPEPLESNPQGLSLPREYDVCVANILQGPLLSLQPRLSRYVKEGGTLILSGILENQVPAIKAAYQADFEGFEIYTEELWALLTARRRKRNSSA